MIAALALTATDSTDDVTVTVAASSGGLTGTVKQSDTGTTLATFTVDQSGNGTITYANGTTASITAWHITG